MLRQPRFASNVSRRAAQLALLLGTENNRRTQLKMLAALKAMLSLKVPSGEASRVASDRTWNASHGITFGSRHEYTRSQTVSHLDHSRSPEVTCSQKDIWLGTEPQTQQSTGSTDENSEGFDNHVLTERPTHLLETSPNGSGHSSEIGQSEGWPASDAETFSSPLGFHIPESKMRNAMLAEPTSTASYWHFTLYQGPGGDGDKVKVHYCKSKETTEKVAQLFLDKEVIGFDIEWQPEASAADGIIKNVSLIQIASEERILLAHIARYPNAANSEKEQRIEDFVAPSLKKIMESPSISKVGVAIKADCTRLRKFLGIDTHGLFELSHLYKLIKYSSGDIKKISKTLVSLAQQVQEHLQLPLAKGNVRTSDWGKVQDLTYEQTRYAASDSYAALQLYYILEAKRSALEPTPPRPAHAELNLAIRLADGQTVHTSDQAVEPAAEATIGAPSSPPISLEDDFRKMAIEDSSSLYPELPASASYSSSSSSSSSSSPSSTSHPPPPPTPSKIRFIAPPVSAQVLEADVSVKKYISESRPPSLRTKPNVAHLRAHHLWQHCSMEPPAIAALLHVEVSTVATYIFQAIRFERFPFDETRARSLVPLAPWMFREQFEHLIRERAGRGDCTGGGGEEGKGAVR